MKPEHGPQDIDRQDAEDLNRKLDGTRDTKSSLTNNQIVSQILSREESERWDQAAKSPEGKAIIDAESRKTKDLMLRKADFYMHEWQEKTGNHSPDMETAFRNLECQTFGDLGWGRMQKSLLGFEIGERVAKAEGTDQDTVYLGSSSDIHFPLAMRARNIKLVDPSFRDSPDMKELLKTEIEKYGEYTVEEAGESTRYSFQFDFGSGKEEVRLDVYPLGAEEYSPDKPVGTLLSFKGNGYTAPFSFPDIDSRLAAGSYIYDSDFSDFAGNVFNEIVERKADYSEFTSQETAEYHDRVQAAALELGLRAIFIPGVDQPVYQVIESTDKLAEYARQEKDKREEKAKRSPDLAVLRDYIKNMPIGSLAGDAPEQEKPSQE